MYAKVCVRLFDFSLHSFFLRLAHELLIFIVWCCQFLLLSNDRKTNWNSTSRNKNNQKQKFEIKQQKRTYKNTHKPSERNTKHFGRFSCLRFRLHVQNNKKCAWWIWFFNSFSFFPFIQVYSVFDVFQTKIVSNEHSECHTFTWNVHQIHFRHTFWMRKFE